MAQTFCPRKRGLFLLVSLLLVALTACSQATTQPAPTPTPPYTLAGGRSGVRLAQQCLRRRAIRGGSWYERRRGLVLQRWRAHLREPCQRLRKPGEQGLQRQALDSR